MDEIEKDQSQQLLKHADDVLDDFEKELARVRREIRFYLDRQRG